MNGSTNTYFQISNTYVESWISQATDYRNESQL